MHCIPPSAAAPPPPAQAPSPWPLCRAVLVWSILTPGRPLPASASSTAMPCSLPYIIKEFTDTTFSKPKNTEKGWGTSDPWGVVDRDHPGPHHRTGDVERQRRHVHGVRPERHQHRHGGERAGVHRPECDGYSKLHALCGEYARRQSRRSVPTTLSQPRETPLSISNGFDYYLNFPVERADAG